jgi:hypothetical protein
LIDRTGGYSWVNVEGTITASTLEELMIIAKTPQFGETGRESLATFMLCQAFENRFDPSIQKAYHLAAMIISRV